MDSYTSNKRAMSPGRGERQAEENFIENTQWAAEFELMNASNRFVEQFARNPFAGKQMQEHALRSPATAATDDNMAAKDVPVVSDASAVSDTEEFPMRGTPAVVAQLQDPFVQAAASRPRNNPTIRGTNGARPTANNHHNNNNTPVAEASVEIATKKSAFKLNPLAKEFVPDPNLIQTPMGFLPLQRAEPPHQRDSFSPYDRGMQLGYEAYHQRLTQARQPGADANAQTNPWA